MKTKKIAALLLIAALAVSLLPTPALAVDPPLEGYGGGGGGGGGGGSCQGEFIYGAGGAGGAGGSAAVTGHAGGDGGPGTSSAAGGGGGGGGIIAAGQAPTISNFSNGGAAGAGGSATDGGNAAGTNGGNGGDGSPPLFLSMVGLDANPASITVIGGSGGDGGGGGQSNTAFGNYRGGSGGNGADGCDIHLGLNPSVVTVPGAVTLTSGFAGRDGANGDDSYPVPSGYYAPGGAGGAGGAVSLTCWGTLTTSSLIITQNDAPASADIDTLLVAPGGTTVTNSGGSLRIVNIQFDPSSTSLSVSGTMDASSVSFTPPATPNGGSSGFSATGFTSGTLTVDPINLSLNTGESITLLTTTGGLPAAWDNLPFGSHVTEIKGNNLLLRNTSPLATIQDVSITGVAGTPLPGGQTATIALTGVNVASALAGVNATGWFTGLPAGVTVAASAPSGGNTITLTFSGTPTAAAASPFNLTIPAGVLTGGIVLPVAANPNAGFAIAAAPQPSPQPTPQPTLQPTLQPPSALPKTGDGFPLHGLLALLGVGLVALAWAGTRLRKRRGRAGHGDGS